jgi:hypothetical protein
MSFSLVATGTKFISEGIGLRFTMRAPRPGAGDVVILEMPEPEERDALAVDVEAPDEPVEIVPGTLMAEVSSEGPAFFGYTN